MFDPLLSFVLIGATVAIAYGVATFPRKARDVLASTSSKPAAEAALIAQARAELEATGWTAEDEAAFQCERAAASGFYESEVDTRV
ncbi:hypothetical protein [uncultured Stenotrophomonas sp.]|uniref:hypothetical protein n=1 Tax=uncultured Stenotrophomonas sp. TaxID=165438 RepID=UPI0025E42486|nr:hypothetical protein [uncultured Stenotrophomonas sp.]